MSNPTSRKSKGKGPKYQSPKQRPSSQPVKFDRKRWGERFTKLGSALKPFAFSHPVIIGLGVMTFTQLAKMGVLTTLDPKKLTFTGASPGGRGSHYTPPTGSRQDVVFTELQGLYDASAALTTALVAVPLISAGASIAGSILSAKAGGSSD